MNKYSELSQIKKLYEKKGINIIEYLKKSYGNSINELSDILISYDFQAGSYIEGYNVNKEQKYKHLQRLAQIIDNFSECYSILECGCGEATSIVPLLHSLKEKTFEWQGGIDISWSRIKYAQEFSKENYPYNVNLAVGNMFHLPCADSSFDIVFTNHAIEPNYGKEEYLLNELFRVTNKYLVLIEPAYELADDSAKKRMEKHGYIQELYSTAKKLGLNITMWELYGDNDNDLNPSGIMIIEKHNENIAKNPVWACPYVKKELTQLKDCYFSFDSLLAYPIIDGVPLLTRNNAVVATKINDFREIKD